MPADVSDITKNLLPLVAAGSEKAFRQLFHLYADLLHTYIQSITKSSELAEEVVQDIFLQIWISRETLHNIRNFRSYLFVISRNHALNIIKQLIRENRRIKQWEESKALHADSDPEHLEYRLSLIEEAVRRLPPQQQKVWVMSRKQGMKYSEIAVATSLSRETVKKYLQYATSSIMQYVASRIDLLVIFLLFIRR
ncbi:RNA polymerase sigma-70 factor, ECF subfamily [Chitinophaga rupis]|uniref:RNA polymerase sigma-70 factor, ECF subfamily n=1 Tax=Chitinophaga rupis TaxID=573321 RepID=A0A1H7GNK9_9BACT|nr:sigma-70 family RNA polymerase sigma factor [Chitinophaga rupis]SEK39671.1 RNA polymerase sigma-70 factor, ECF subfamily [Chitinophaga rupis]